MSDQKLIKVNCHHSGHFKSENGVMEYVDGVVFVVELDSGAIFSDLILKLLEKRIGIGRMWYKLPFEDVADRHSLWETVDKSKMQSAARWMGEVDVYVEIPVVEEGKTLADENERVVPQENERAVPKKTDGNLRVVPEGEVRAVPGDEVRALLEGEVRAVPGDEVRALLEGEVSDGEADPAYEPEDEMSDEEVNDEEDGLSDMAESGDEDEVGEADIEVFNHDNYEDQIPDEDEVYPATDDSSGDEEEQAERLVRRNLPDGVFSLRQLFSSGKEFKQNVIRYVLQTKRNVVNDRWEKNKLGARCKGKGCSWRIYCSVENPIGKWMVKTYEDEHQCHPVGRCELIKSPVIADLFLEDIRKDPEMSAPEIKDKMKSLYNIIITPAQSQSARRKAFQKLQHECNEQFSRLRDYMCQLLNTMEGSTVEINTKTREDGTDEFYQIYICFEPLKTSWKQNCRPIIGLDGTFLKHNIQGILLTAVGRDPNNQIYPIAWAVVSGENHDNWEWFIHKLKVDLGLGDGENITIISDMHRSIIHGMAMELPRAEHRACARHIYANLKKLHKSDTLKPLFWKVASSYNEADFKANLAVFREMDPKACDDLLKKDHRKWCRAFFRTDPCCADTHNNHTESYNRTLKKARRKPFVEMLELVRRDAMQRIAIRSTIADKETAKYTKKARKELEKSCEEAQNCRSLSSTGGKYEILEFGTGFTVSLSKRECRCRKWDLTGIPCRHAVCAIRENCQEVEDFISDYYLTEKWRDTYRRGLTPVDGMKFWEETGGRRIYAPPYKPPPGRPKGKARIKGVHESPTKKKKKVGRQGRESHCGLCGGAGHNSRRCPNESEESRAKRRKVNEDARNAAALEAQDEAEMEAAMIAQEEAAMIAQDEAAMAMVVVQEEVEVQDVSSTAPQGTQWQW